ncbi:MAG: glycine dehydrogenase, partial [Acidimicrobiales bacterium]
MHFVPHTDAEVAGMLAAMGLSSVEELFDAVPAALRLAGGLDLEPGLAEADVAGRFDAYAAANRPVGRDLVCFAGAGAYDHDIPSVVNRLAFRSEFVTSYTPYQPEVAQGVLQALFEYQTLVCRLFGLDVANASLYDGASACVEAVNLAVAATGRSEVWVSRGVHPHWRGVMATMAEGTGHRLVEVALDDGLTAFPGDGEPGAVVVQNPNYLG